MHVVFVHGLGGAAALWDAARGALHAVSRARGGDAPTTSAVELPGCGARAGEPPGRTLDDVVGAVDERIRRDSGDVVIVGHSLGGAVAQYLAARRDDVRALVLVSTFLDNPPGDDMRRLLADDEAAFRALLLEHIYGTTPTTALSQRLFLATSPAVLDAHLEASAGFDGAALAARARDRVRATSLVGRGDALVREERRKRLVEAWGAEDRLIDAGHMVPDEAPTEVARAVVDVIDRLA
jgi:pimeloyl-ACP methyl ester carboxylesterase